MRTALTILALAVAACCTAYAQQSPASTSASDPVLETASSYVGRALFLRCFCAENNLTFNAQGEPAGNIKPTDWTLAGFNLQKVERKGPEMLELQGVRVAIRYAPDRHEFERHPQADTKLRISLPAARDARSMDTLMARVFSVGIDVALQRAMPAYWQHYFDSRLEWPQDEFTGHTVYGFVGVQPKDGPVMPPSVEHRVDSGYTSEAQRDHVRGVTQLRVVVDEQGVAHRIAIAKPLGYGLDEKAVEMMAKFRFHPATDHGKAVPAMVVLQQEYVPVQLPHP